MALFLYVEYKAPGAKSFVKDGTPYATKESAETALKAMKVKSPKYQFRIRPHGNFNRTNKL